jgi:hypothetical protein
MGAIAATQVGPVCWRRDLAEIGASWVATLTDRRAAVQGLSEHATVPSPELGTAVPAKTSLTGRREQGWVREFESVDRASTGSGITNEA